MSYAARTDCLTLAKIPIRLPVNAPPNTKLTADLTVLEYTFNGQIKWERAIGTPDAQLHLYSHEGVIGKPLHRPCVDDQFYGDSETVSPIHLFAASVATSHMFAFLELCGENAYSIKAYTDDPIAYATQDDEWVLEKLILTPKTFFEGQSVPEHNVIQELHKLASRKGMLEKIVAADIEVRPM